VGGGFGVADGSGIFEEGGGAESARALAFGCAWRFEVPGGAGGGVGLWISDRSPLSGLLGAPLGAVGGRPCAVMPLGPGARP
jgi:hypothetical protein